MVIILMGVSGCGKTTVGLRLANDLNLPFFDADDFHPPENVQKMKNGNPLTDTDREPWLLNLSDKIEEWDQSSGAILACSALKKKYRDILCSGTAEVIFVFLKGSKEVILNRMKDREDHYMPVSLLNSQFETLEEPEIAIIVSIDHSPDEICTQIKYELSKMDI